ncbi:GNAT family N-acetyltransferase [Acinetobacter stercoris]|uniref:Putative acetyltransferase n=1 Tax=Acinetobacter stercoris TaxID=2126983 RepID=A0A2U3MVE1_9GAMM|nr:GNAT family N-acetyltransferase [Acinetobacter stercoris]SPL69269.1 putative acetyltransferase [Acinetobacter stercoris]
MIRLANVEDAKHIAQVHVQSWQETYQGMVDQAIIDSKTLEKRTTMWKMVLADSQQRVWVYEENDNILGFSDVCFSPSKRDAELKAIYILKEAQGKGVGSHFLNELFKILKQQKYQSLSVYVFQKNPSRYFYEKFGAKLVGEADASDYGKGLKELHYIWNLNV